MVIVEDAFHFAAVCNDVQKLNELLAAGADVNARDKVRLRESRCSDASEAANDGLAGVE